MRLLVLLILSPFCLQAQTFSSKEIAAYTFQAQHVTIVRDSWGIPHLYGKSDADAVFGLLYAQCEENFRQVELNNLEMLGRLSEVYGESQLYNDLQMRLIYDTAKAIADYKRSPVWLRKLLDASAAGVNYFLYKHPETKPLVLQRFEPWFALLRTNGSISATQTGGISSSDMRNLYPLKNNLSSSLRKPLPFYEVDPTGSNGFAVGPSKTRSGNAILYINPHVTFYFRSEVQMVSEEGLNAYGAVTWGCFFVFQGFNEYCGWMHTSGMADVADLFEEKVEDLHYTFDGKDRKVQTKPIVIRYKKGNGFEEQQFTGYATLHGPVMGKRNDKWLSLRENNRSLDALMQSWLRTKARGFEEFKKVMNLRSNTSDNTVFADNKGNIAYWHGNFVPRRNPALDYSGPVDGTTSASDWKGIYALDSIVHVYNPATGWIQNCNSTPFTVSGSSSPRKQDYPVYMAPDGQNYRSINAARLLDSLHDFTIETMIEKVGYSHYLSAFEVLLPPLFRAYDELPVADSLRSALKEPMTVLRSWNYFSSDTSVAAALAIEWAYRMAMHASPSANAYDASDAVRQMQSMVLNTTAVQKLQLLKETIQDLQKRFGQWATAWGADNRYQRTAGDAFNDDKPSLPSGLAAATWGSIPSFATRRFPNANRRYGVSGNSFVACVEFGKKIRAKSVVTGGQSFDPASAHFTDQASMYLNGKFKEVLFYREDVLKHTERKYHPGE